jgi:Rap/ran-GAP
VSRLPAFTVTRLIMSSEGLSQVPLADTESTSVNSACEVLWGSQTMLETLECLRTLHTALLREPLGLYDPSRVFWTVQGTVLRYQSDPSNNTRQDNVHQYADNVHSLLKEAALWTTAALAHVCVGPVWSQQTLRRRRILERRKYSSNSTPDSSTPSSNEVTSISSYNLQPSIQGSIVHAVAPAPAVSSIASTSYSPLLSSGAIMHNNRQSRSDQPEYATIIIPESLPVTMIRFAEGLMLENDTMYTNRPQISSIYSTITESMVNSIYIPPNWIQAHIVVISALACPVGNVSSESDSCSTPNLQLVPGMTTHLTNAWYIWKRVLEIPSDANNKDDTALSENELQKSNSLQDALHSDMGSHSLLQQPHDPPNVKLLILRALADLWSTGWPPSDHLLDESILPTLLSDSLLKHSDETAGSGLSSAVQNDNIPNNALHNNALDLEIWEAVAALSMRGCIPYHWVETILSKLLSNNHLHKHTQRHLDNGSSKAGPALDREEPTVEVVIWSLLLNSHTAPFCASYLLKMLGPSKNNTTNNDEKNNSDNDTFHTPAGISDSMSDAEFVQHCCLVISILSGAFWGDMPRMQSIKHLRLYWAPFLHCHVVLAQLAMSPVPTGNPLASQEALHCQMKIVTELLSSLRRAVENEIRQDDAGFSCIEWDITCKCLETILMPVDRIRRMQTKGACSTALSAAMHSITNSIADLFQCSIYQSHQPIYDCETQKRLKHIMLQCSTLIQDEYERDHVIVSTLRFVATFRLPPHKLTNCDSSAADILLDTFAKSDTDSSYLYSSQVRLQTLRFLTFGMTSSADTAYDDYTVSFFSWVMHTGGLHGEFVSALVKVTSDLFVSQHMLSPDAQIHYLSRKSSVMLPRNQLEAPTLEQISKLLFHSAKLSSSTTDDSVSLQLYSISVLGHILCTPEVSMSVQKEVVSVLKAITMTRQQDNAARVYALIELCKCLVMLGSKRQVSWALFSLIANTVCCILTYLSTEEMDESPLESICLLIALSAIARLCVPPAVSCYNDKHSGKANALDEIKHFFSLSTKCGTYAHLLCNFLPSPLVVLLSRLPSLTSSASASTSSGDVVSRQSTVVSAVKSTLVTLLTTLVPDEAKHNIIYSTIQRHIRVTCYFCFRSLVLTRVITLEDDILELLLTSAATLSPEEALVRSYCLASQLQISLLAITGRVKDTGDVDNQADDAERAGLLLQKLLKLSSLSRSEVEIQVGLEVISAFVPCLVRTLGADSMLQLVLMHVTEVGKAIVQSHDSSHRSDKILEAYLSLVHDLFLYDLGWRDKSPTLQVVLGVCRHVFVNSDVCCEHVKQLALRCVIATIDALPASEIGQMSSVVTSGTDQTQWERLVLERIHARNNLSATSLTTCENLTKEDALVKEVESIDAFACTKPEIISTHVLTAAEDKAENERCWWYDLPAILTCRIGAQDSRYYGWVEVVARSPTHRERRLVRLRKYAILDVRSTDKNTLVWSKHSQDDRSAKKVTRQSLREMLDSDALRRAQRITQMLDAEASVEPTLLPNNQHYTSILDCDHGCNVDLVEWLKSMYELDKETCKDLEEAIVSVLESCGVDKSQVSTGVRLSSGIGVKRAVSVLDRIPVFHSHRVGIMHSDDLDKTCAPNSGSTAYYSFLTRLGQIVPVSTLKYFSGGLDVSSYQSDGKFALRWIDEAALHSLATTNVIIFHTANLFPSDQTIQKRHIGNDNVVIVYSDSPQSSNPGEIHSRSPTTSILSTSPSSSIPSSSLISGSFGFISIHVTMLDTNTKRISAHTRKNFGGKHFAVDVIVDAQDAAPYIRALAIRADLACRSVIATNEAASNCTERYNVLQQLQRYKTTTTTSAVTSTTAILSETA